MQLIQKSLILFLFFSSFLFGQNVAPVLQATGNQIYCPQTSLPIVTNMSFLTVLNEAAAGAGYISDDGVGLPTGFDLLTSANLGLQIVRTLTENELKGELRLESTDKGTHAKLRFPL